MNPDGSGTWTRYDPAAVKFRVLYMTGPSVAEVTRRDTFDAKTGELLESMTDFAYNRAKCADLPEPRPRALRTVFHFTKTKAETPPCASSRLVSGGPREPTRVLRLAEYL